jgi:hypothetical protein
VTLDSSTKRARDDSQHLIGRVVVERAVEMLSRQQGVRDHELDSVSAAKVASDIVHRRIAEHELSASPGQVVGRRTTAPRHDRVTALEKTDVAGSK